jgi:DNA adenine methylase
MVEAIQRVQTVSTEKDARIVRADKLTSLLKWAGGKEQELRYILPKIPAFHRYYEPFVGGGAVYFSLQAEGKKYINDRSSELINLYRMVADNNLEFFQTLNVLLAQWRRISELVSTYVADLITFYNVYSTDGCSMDELKEGILEFILCYTEEFKNMHTWSFDKNVENFFQEIKKNLLRKLVRMKKLEDKKGKLTRDDVVANIESALKSAFYVHLRHLYNNIEGYEIPLSSATAIFFFVRENAYASMFRYNSHGEFNVPYGGISYNRKDLAKKIAYMQSPEVHRHLTNTVIENMDFEDFLQKYIPEADDFIFLDPPYDSEFSTYTQNKFSREDQERLAHYLLKQCEAKFMLVIKKTSTISNLYNNRGLNIRAFNKKYLVSFQDRNNRESEHLIITNF